MPTAHRKALKKKTKSKPVKPRKASHPHKSSPKTISHSKRKTTTEKEYVTYVYECTRPGCGYKIWRDDKGDRDSLSSTINGPKGNKEKSRVLAKGVSPKAFK